MAPRVRTSTQVSFANFDKRMQTLGARVYRRSNEGVKQLATVLVESLIDDTPKLTNQAAANWQVGVGTKPSTFKEGFVDLAAAKGEAKQAIQARKSGETIHAVNLTPYIDALNNGSSTQAPQDFVQKAIHRANGAAKNIKLLKD